MDFFEAQARAKQRTTRLVVLFGFAVAGTIAAAYVGAVFGFGALNQQRNQRYAQYHYAEASTSVSLWQPKILLAVTAATLAIVGFASLFKWGQFSSGGSAVAESVGGRRVDPHSTHPHERRLLN
ncbi:MAG: peptidase M48, partial [Opitutus sp.]